MITGRVSPDREAIICLQVLGPNGQQLTIDAEIDTGFLDFLTLSPAQIATLELPHRASLRAMLGDGSTVALPVYTATVLWDGQPRQVDILATDSGSLVGMALLHGSRLTIDVIDGGQVIIEALP